MIARRLATLYILTLPLSAVFRLGPTLPIPLLTGFLIAGFLLFRQGRGFVLLQADVGLILIAGLGILGTISLSAAVSPTNARHFIAFVAAIVCYYWAPRSLFRLVGLGSATFTWERLSVFLRFGLFVVSIATIFETFLATTTDTYLLDFLPSGIDASKLSRPDLIFGLKRPRGFADEPGFAALFYEVAAPLAWVHDRRRTKNTVLWLLVFTSYLLLASAASFFSLVVACIVAVTFFRSNRFRFRLVVTSLLLVGIALTSGSASFYLSRVTGRKLTTLIETTEFGTTRKYIYETGVEILGRFPFGLGWGGLSQSFRSGVPVGEGLPRLSGGGALNLYLEIGLAAGWLGLAIFLFFVLSKLTGALRRARASGDVTLMALAGSAIAVSTHHLFLSHFYLPYIWFALALVDVSRRQFASKPTETRQASPPADALSPTPGPL